MIKWKQNDLLMIYAHRNLLLYSWWVSHLYDNKVLRRNRIQYRWIWCTLTHWWHLRWDLYGSVLILLVYEVVHFQLQVVEISRIVHWNWQVSMTLSVWVLVKESCLLVRLENVVCDQSILKVCLTLTWRVCNCVCCGAFIIECLDSKV